ncbi:hypothetical protein PLESTM_000511800 [Pleodorina starrii]|nr:hypothetical protein PLESTM_000511800 [Pleodorina starrii]
MMLNLRSSAAAAAPVPVPTWQDARREPRGYDDDEYHEYGQRQVQSGSALPRAALDHPSGSASASGRALAPQGIDLTSGAGASSGPVPGSRNGGGGFQRAYVEDEHAGEVFFEGGAGLDPAALAAAMARALAAHGMALPPAPPPPPLLQRSGPQSNQPGPHRTGGAYPTAAAPPPPLPLPLLEWAAAGLPAHGLDGSVANGPPLHLRGAKGQAMRLVLTPPPRLPQPQPQLLPQAAEPSAHSQQLQQLPGHDGSGRGFAGSSGRDGVPQLSLRPEGAAAAAASGGRRPDDADDDDYDDDDNDAALAWQNAAATLAAAAAGQHVLAQAHARPRAKAPAGVSAAEPRQHRGAVAAAPYEGTRGQPPAPAAADSWLTAVLLIPRAFVCRGIPDARPGERFPVVLTVNDGRGGAAAAERGGGGLTEAAAAAASGHYPGALVVQRDGSGVLAEGQVSEAIARYQGWATVGWTVAQLSESLGGVYWVEWRVRKPPALPVAAAPPATHLRGCGDGDGGGGEEEQGGEDEEALVAALQALVRQQQALQEQLARVQTRRGSQPPPLPPQQQPLLLQQQPQRPAWQQQQQRPQQPHPLLQQQREEEEVVEKQQQRLWKQLQNQLQRLQQGQGQGQWGQQQQRWQRQATDWEAEADEEAEEWGAGGGALAHDLGLQQRYLQQHQQQSLHGLALPATAVGHAAAGAVRHGSLRRNADGSTPPLVPLFECSSSLAARYGRATSQVAGAAEPFPGSPRPLWQGADGSGPFLQGLRCDGAAAPAAAGTQVYDAGVRHGMDGRVRHGGGGGEGGGSPGVSSLGREAAAGGGASDSILLPPPRRSVQQMMSVGRPPAAAAAADDTRARPSSAPTQSHRDPQSVAATAAATAAAASVEQDDDVSRRDPQPHADADAPPGGAAAGSAWMELGEGSDVRQAQQAPTPAMSPSGTNGADAPDGSAEPDRVVARSAPRQMSRYLTSGEIRILFTERDSRVLCSPPCGLLLSLQMFLDGRPLGPPQEAQLCRYNSSSPRYLTSVPSQELTSPPIPWKRLADTSIQYRRTQSGRLQLWATRGGGGAAAAGGVLQLTAKAAAAMPSLVTFKPAGLRRAAWLAAAGGGAETDRDADGDDGDSDGGAGPLPSGGGGAAAAAGYTAAAMGAPPGQRVDWGVEAVTRDRAGAGGPGPAAAVVSAAAQLPLGALGTFMAGRGGGCGGGGHGDGEDTAAQAAAARRALALLAATAVKSEQDCHLAAAGPAPEPNGLNYQIPSGEIRAGLDVSAAARVGCNGPEQEPSYCTEVLVACPPRSLSRYVTKAELELLVGPDVYEQLCGGNKMTNVRVMFEVNGRRLPEVFIADIERYNASSPFYLKAASGRGVDGLPWRSIPPSATVQWRRMADNTLVLAQVSNPSAGRSRSSNGRDGGGSQHRAARRSSGGARRRGGGGGGGRGRRRRSADGDTNSEDEMAYDEYGSEDSDTDAPAARKRRRRLHRGSEALGWDVQLRPSYDSAATGSGGADDQRRRSEADAHPQGRPAPDDHTAAAAAAAAQPGDALVATPSAAAAAAAPAAAASGLGVLIGSASAPPQQVGPAGDAAGSGGGGGGGGSSFISRIVATNLYIGRRQLQALYGTGFKADTRSDMRLSLNGALMPELYHVQWKEGCHKGSFYPKGAPLGQLRGRFLQGIHWLDEQRNLLVAISWDQPPDDWPVRRRRMTAAGAAGAAGAAAKPRRWLWQRQAERSKKREEGDAATAEAAAAGLGWEVSGGFGRLLCVGERAGGGGGGSGGRLSCAGPASDSLSGRSADPEEALAMEDEGAAAAAAATATAEALAWLRAGRQATAAERGCAAVGEMEGCAPALDRGAGSGAAEGPEEEEEEQEQADGKGGQRREDCEEEPRRVRCGSGEAAPGVAAAAASKEDRGPAGATRVSRGAQLQHPELELEPARGNTAGVLPGDAAAEDGSPVGPVMAGSPRTKRRREAVMAAGGAGEAAGWMAAEGLAEDEAARRKCRVTEWVGAVDGVASERHQAHPQHQQQQQQQEAPPPPQQQQQQAGASVFDRASFNKASPVDSDGGARDFASVAAATTCVDAAGCRAAAAAVATERKRSWPGCGGGGGGGSGGALAAVHSFGGSGGLGNSGEECSKDACLDPLSPADSPPLLPPPSERRDAPTPTAATSAAAAPTAAADAAAAGAGATQRRLGSAAHGPAAQVLQLPARDCGVARVSCRDMQTSHHHHHHRRPHHHHQQQYQHQHQPQHPQRQQHHHQTSEQLLNGKTTSAAGEHLDEGRLPQQSGAPAPLLGAVQQSCPAPQEDRLGGPVTASADGGVSAAAEGAVSPRLQGGGEEEEEEEEEGDSREATEELVIRTMPWISMHLAQKWYPEAVLSASQAPHPVQVAIEADGVLQPERYPAQLKSYPYNNSVFLPGLPVKLVRGMIRIGWRKLPDRTLVLIVRSANPGDSASPSAAQQQQ